MIFGEERFVQLCHISFRADLCVLQLNPFQRTAAVIILSGPGIEATKRQVLVASDQLGSG